MLTWLGCLVTNVMVIDQRGSNVHSVQVPFDTHIGLHSYVDSIQAFNVVVPAFASLVCPITIIGLHCYITPYKSLTTVISQKKKKKISPI